MSMSNLRDPVLGKWRPHRAGIVALGILVLAISSVGAWLSLRPSAIAPMLDTGSVTGSQRAFTFTPHTSSRLVSNVELVDGGGQKRTLADFRGKVVLLNVWATWCGPCRTEMPALDRLQSKLGSQDFEVVALSIDRGGQAVVKSFYDEIDLRVLTIYVDATAEAQSKLGILGIPTTLLIDQAGREVARYTGPAEWDRPEIIDTIRRYLPPHKS